MPVFTGTQLSDTLSGSVLPDTLFGLDGDDILFGGAGNDRLFGGAGDDILDPGLGVDAVNGGPGIDTLSFASQPSAMFVVLGQSSQQALDAFTQQLAPPDAARGLLAEIENVVGSRFDDAIGGDEGPNALFGGPGNDLIVGFGGNDSLAGGPGGDAFAFPALSQGVDTIADFEPGIDAVTIERSSVLSTGQPPLTGVMTLAADGDPLTLAADGTLFIGGLALVQFTGFTPNAGDILLF